MIFIKSFYRLHSRLVFTGGWRELCHRFAEVCFEGLGGGGD